MASVLSSDVRQGAGVFERNQRLVHSPTPTAALAGFASELDIGLLNVDEVRFAKRHLLDGVGACVAGASQPLVRDAASVLARVAGTGTSPIVGMQRKADLLSSVYLMSASCHALELDDGNREGSVHPGCVIIPAILGLGSDRDADGATALCALVAGYEVIVSLAEVLHPHAGRRGFQTTGVVGAAGAAAASGRLLGVNAEVMEKAMGIGASSGAGLFAYLTGGGNVKKLHPAHAAREGVFAAMLATEDVVDGPTSVAETKAGIFQAFGGIYPWEASIGQGRSELAITRSYLKPYPCCRHIHPAIDSLLAMKQQYAIDPDSVESIEIGTYDAAMPHASLGWDSLTIAQLSFPYVMAAALRTGVIDLETFSDSSRSNPQIIADTAKIRVYADPECCRSYPKQGPARVTVHLKNGDRHSLYVADPQGCPEKPMSDELLFQKFRMMVSGSISSSRADELIDMIWTIEKLSGIRRLTDALCV